MMGCAKGSTDPTSYDLSGPTMMAGIGILRALNRNVVREFDSSRKDTHWGKRKLKRLTVDIPR
jgi:hypothetical protein